MRRGKMVGRKYYLELSVTSPPIEAIVTKALGWHPQIPSPIFELRSNKTNNVFKLTKRELEAYGTELARQK